MPRRQHVPGPCGIAVAPTAHEVAAPCAIGTAAWAIAARGAVGRLEVPAAPRLSPSQRCICEREKGRMWEEALAFMSGMAWDRIDMDTLQSVCARRVRRGGRHLRFSAAWRGTRLMTCRRGAGRFCSHAREVRARCRPLSISDLSAEGAPREAVACSLGTARKGGAHYCHRGVS